MRNEEEGPVLPVVDSGNIDRPSQRAAEVVPVRPWLQEGLAVCGSPREGIGGADEIFHYTVKAFTDLWLSVDETVLCFNFNRLTQYSSGVPAYWPRRRGAVSHLGRFARIETFT